jgi:hypothetical protein
MNSIAEPLVSLFTPFADDTWDLVIKASADTDLTQQFEALRNETRKPPIRCESPTDYVPPDLRKALLATCYRILNGGRLQLIDEGMSGAYFCRDKKGKPVAVFKPRDEEPMSPNNPKSLKGNIGDMSIKKGVLAGEQAIREVAAFALDRGHARVPPTIMVSMDLAQATKTGSYQLYMDSLGPSGDMGSGMFDSRDAQAIAVLDMRLFNTDRHDGNILVQDESIGGKKRLIPIDHGCCLPDSLNVCWYEWTWLHWPQLKEPILPSVRDFILSVDVDLDAQTLRQMGIRLECIHTMTIASRFLQLCVQHKPSMTLADIGELMCRADSEVPSLLERLTAKARWQATTSALNKKMASHLSFQYCFQKLVFEFLSR